MSKSLMIILIDVYFHNDLIYRSGATALYQPINVMKIINNSSQHARDINY